MVVVIGTSNNIVYSNEKKSFILVNFFTIGKNALVSNILGMQPYEVVKANHIILNLQMSKTKLGEVKWFA